MQVPSMFSALKHQGQPLYKYARKGIEIEREARPVTIYELELIRFNNNEVELEIECSKGTYIRSLARDMGESLNSGAHLVALSRTKIGPFLLNEALKIEEFEKDLAQV